MPPKAHYLSGLRQDNLLDGLIGQGPHHSGGGWANPWTGLGTFGRDKTMQGRFDEPFRITDPELAALYNANDLAKRIVTTVPREMFRRGWVLVIPQDDPEIPDDTSREPGEENSQPTGGESGPAAPGAPLVDPMGVGSDNSRAPQVAPAAVGSNESNPQQVPSPDPMGDKLAKDPIQKAFATDPQQNPGTVTAPMTAKSNKKPAPPPQDQSEGANLALQLEAYASRLGLIPRCLEACIFGRLYGGGLLIIGADDGADMSTPLKEDSIKSIRYLTWIDRRFIFASTWYSQIGPKYGEVESWEIINPFGGQANTRIHETRCIRFDGAAVDFLMRRRLLGWTLSVLQAPYDVLRQFDQSFQSISNLMADLSQAVMSINGLAQLISNDQKTLQTRMQMVDISRSSARMLYIDAENEKFERTATPLTGVADTIQMQMLRVASAAEMPVALLFGREPSGLNATGDADFRRFYDVTAGAQRQDLEPKLRRLYTLICLAKDSPCKGREPARGVQFVWHKLYEPSEKEQAEIRWLMAQADDKYINNGALLPEEVALSRFRSGDLHLDTEIETELRDEALDEAELPPSGAEKAATDTQLQTMKIQAGAKPGGNPVGIKPVKNTVPDQKRKDAWDDARFDAAVDDVHDIMLEDFPEEAISWVHSAPWRGPVSVALSKIDYSNRAKWHASKPGEQERVDKFKDALDKGEAKPIILVQTPSGKAIIVDGHHRALAAYQRGDKTIKAYISKVTKNRGPWDDTHSKQTDRRSG